MLGDADGNNDGRGDEGINKTSITMIKMAKHATLMMMIVMAMMPSLAQISILMTKQECIIVITLILHEKYHNYNK